MLDEDRLVHFLHSLRLHRGSPRGRHDRVRDSDHHGAYQVFQVSTLNALLEGLYEGSLSFGELRRHGDFGLGTFNALDGEMIALDGDFYQIRGDGSVHSVADRTMTPFAVVQFFRPEWQESIEGPVDFDVLKSSLSSKLPSSNYFYSIRLDGHFDYLKARSVPRQMKPYPPLAEVAKSQSIFEFRDVSGSLIGFRFPDYTQGLNLPGFHLHFITDDRRAGGHVLELVLAHGQLSVEHTHDFYIELPESEDFGKADLAKDNAATAREVEE